MQGCILQHSEIPNTHIQLPLEDTHLLRAAEHARLYRLAEDVRIPWALPEIRHLSETLIPYFLEGGDSHSFSASRSSARFSDSVLRLASRSASPLASHLDLSKALSV